MMMAIAAKKTVTIDTPPMPKSNETSVIEATAESMTAPVAEMQENVRKAVEKTVADARDAYAKAKTAAEEATGAMETSLAAAKTGIVEINAKALDAMRANVEANFDLVHALIGAKSVSDYVALQAEFARKQIESLTSQAKELGALAQKVANESAAPIKDQVARTFKIAM
jgi:phasin